MRKKHFIVIVFELGLKTESEIEPATLFFHSILEVANVFTVPLPADPRLIVRLSFGVNEGFHPLIVGTLGLD